MPRQARGPREKGWKAVLLSWKPSPIHRSGRKDEGSCQCCESCIAVQVSTLTMVPFGIKCPSTLAPGEIRWSPNGIGGTMRRPSSITALRQGSLLVESPVISDGLEKLPCTSSCSLPTGRTDHLEMHGGTSETSWLKHGSTVAALSPLLLLLLLLLFF